MKYSLIVLLLIVSLLGCGGCTITNEGKNLIETTGEEKTDTIPQLTVTAEKENIESVSLINSEVSFEKDIFKFAFENNEMTDIKYIKNDEKITLNFGNTPPNNVTVKDISLNSKGECLYSDKLDKDISLKKKGDNFIFYLKANLNSLLSSEFIPGDKQFRGFKITATWEKKEYIYSLVIKSDIM